MILRLSSGLRPKVLLILRNRKCCLTTESTTESSFSKVKQILEVPGTSEAPRKAPGRLKNFHEKYVRRPMYGFAMKGDYTYKELHKIIWGVTIFTAVCWGICCSVSYIRHKYFMTEDDQLLLDHYRARNKFNPDYDQKIADFTRSFNEFQAYSDLGRFVKHQEFDPTQHMWDGKIPTARKFSGAPVESIVKAEDVLHREMTGRKAKVVEYTKKTLKDIDVSIREIP